MPLPKAASFQDSEDLENLETNIQTLFDKFIKPIDSIRSQALPLATNSSQQSASNEFKNLQVSSNQVFESRCHAFYRMLGLPVVAGNSFYNSGFNPFANNETKEKIKLSFFQNQKDLYNLMQQRERDVLDKKNTFAKQDIFSSLYALSLKNVPLFNLLESDDPMAVEKQSFSISDRNIELSELADNNPDFKDIITKSISKIESGQKIIKPFIIDPRIDATVMPDKKQICVPFLPTKESTQIETNSFLQRPGLELILRQRLNNSIEDPIFLKQVENIIKEKKSVPVDSSTLSVNSLVETLQALSDDNNITEKTKSALNGISSYQLLIINQLVKTLKILIQQIVGSAVIIDKAKYEINWFPLCSIDGPITGVVGAKLGQIGLKGTQNSLIERKIVEVKIKKLNAERQNISFDELGFFASPFISNAALDGIEDYQNQLDELQNKKNKISNDAFIALSRIEMIVGEVAGFGLMDVIAFYLAFWSLDLTSLIGFLDNDAFERLYTDKQNFKGVKEVSDRKNAGPQIEITKALKNFENRLRNIYSFIDKSYVSYYSLNKNTSTGSI